jgi:hypothetical protein
MSNFTRRSMLAAGVGAVGVGIVGGPTGAFASAIGGKPSGLPARSQFAPAVGTLFTASADKARHKLKLVDILDVPPVTVPGDELAFNLLFEEPGGLRLVDGIYKLTSVRVPSCTLFLSPVDHPGHQPRVQALINRRSA